MSEISRRRLVVFLVSCVSTVCLSAHAGDLSADGATGNSASQLIAKLDVPHTPDNLDKAAAEVSGDATGILLHKDQGRSQNNLPAKQNAIVSPQEKISDAELSRLRDIFQEAETALKRGNEARYLTLVEQLEKYPLYPYIRYQWLKKHLHDDDSIKHFLTQEKSSRYAPILRRKWLNYLAKNQRWQTFDQFYRPTSNTVLNCYHAQAKYHLGEKKVALSAASKLWAVGFSQPRQCDALFSLLKKSSYFTQDLLWQRFDAALRKNKTGLAIYVKNQMAGEYQPTAQLWLQLHRHPERHLKKLLALKAKAGQADAVPGSSQWPRMFAQAIKRLSSSDINTAIAVWDENKEAFKVSGSLLTQTEKKLAFALVFSRESGAYERLDQLHVHDDSSREWRIRTALREQDWDKVILAINALDEEDRNKDKWQYWLARADLETGKVEQAENLFTELSVKRSYYGYLAADRINNLYQLADRPLDISTELIDAIKYRKEFMVAHELLLLDRSTEAKTQWWHALRGLDKQEILAASKLAKQWQWDEIAIFTIAKAKYWDDIALRFPLSYADKVMQNALEQKLNPAILFGLIRRESAFNENAHSPAGARGLMQIMPGTGRQIARHFNDRWRGKNSLYDPVRNLKYGSYYYQKLLKQFDGHYAIALAAYNAGPHKVKKWLPETESVPADIWIETIPYRETREYVSTVLAYTLIYQQRTDKKDLTMRQMTAEVKPLNLMSSSDP